jgi:hypothetical protein
MACLQPCLGVEIKGFTMPTPCHSSPFPRTARRAAHWAAYSLLALNLTACGGGNEGSATTANTSATPPTIKAQMAQLESSGALPALDRSTSIAGPDANGNGVRDDIDAYIARLPLTPEQQRAALQKAKTLQMTLTIDNTNKTEVQRVGDALMASSKCLSKNFAEGRSDMSSRIESMTANTRERAKRYMEYNTASSGSTTTWPNGDTCE